jgi:hypothetical protein
MLNNAFVSENARHFAAKLVAEVPTDQRAQIHRAYQMLFGRAPADKEVSIAEQFLAAATKRNESAAWSEYVHVLLCTSEFCYVD